MSVNWDMVSIRKEKIIKSNKNKLDWQTEQRPEKAVPIHKGLHFVWKKQTYIPGYQKHVYKF